jgi:hypothetical protein
MAPPARVLHLGEESGVVPFNGIDKLGQFIDVGVVKSVHSVFSWCVREHSEGLHHYQASPPFGSGGKVIEEPGCGFPSTGEMGQDCGVGEAVA